MYYRSETVDLIASRLLANAACAVTRWHHFSAQNYIVAAVLKV